MMSRRTFTAAFAAASMTFSALTLTTTTVLASDHGAPAMAKAGDIAVSQAWARASAGMARAGGGFLILENTGSGDDKLIAAKADVSEVVELHTHIREGDVMRMRPVEDIPVPAGETVSLQPGGLHVMFINLKDKLVEGTHFPLTLVFEKSGETTIDVEVKGVGAMGSGAMNHGTMNHGTMNHGAMKQGGMKQGN